MKLLILLLLSVNLWAINADSIFARGNSHFENENFFQAIRTYEQLLNHVEHEYLYYNLGNAYYRIGNIGNAVWAYEKGLRFDPRNSDLKHNLDLANTRVKDRIEIPPGFVLVDWYRAVKNWVTLNDLLFWGALFLMLTTLCYALVQFRFMLRPWFVRLQSIFIILTIVIHGIWLDKYWDLTENEVGIIVEQKVNVYSIPAARNEMIVFKVHEGLQAEITHGQDQWVEINLLDGKKGWIPKSVIRLL